MSTRILVRLRTADGDQDQESLERATAELRSELLDLDVADVTTVGAGPAPAGTRASEVTEIGSLLVSLAEIPEMLGRLVGAVRGWLTRDGGEHTAELTIGGDTLVVRGVSAATQERLIEAWLRAHALDAAALDTAALDAAALGSAEQGSAALGSAEQG